MYNEIRSPGKKKNRNRSGVTGRLFNFTGVKDNVIVSALGIKIGFSGRGIKPQFQKYDGKRLFYIILYVYVFNKISLW